jgi:urocanate hydratase
LQKPSIKAIKNGEIGPVVLGRDHHDVSGTDSPYRETSIFMTVPIYSRYGDS